MSKNVKIIKLENVSSTSDFLCEHADVLDEYMAVALTNYQYAGRGQGSNKWESEPGKNLLASILTHPTAIKASSQFVLSMAGALAVKEAIGHYTGELSLKWPNDVYWKDSKISGTLIETRLQGKTIKHCIFGIGINVNQQKFLSDAPNPVSLAQITGHETPVEEVLEHVIEAFSKYYGMACEGQWNQISELYHASLYRREGFHTYKDCNGQFLGRIERVDSDGHLILEDGNGNERKYAFKEISYIINKQHGKV